LTRTRRTLVTVALLALLALPLAAGKFYVDLVAKIMTFVTSSV